jgi:hypothetical protein
VGGRQEADVGWRRIVALTVPLAVLFFALGFVVGLEVRRGPNWRVELDAYMAQRAPESETVQVVAVVEAKRPWAFTAAMGTPAGGRITPTFPPQAVRCAVLERTRVGGERTREVVFLVRHSDALYNVGWLAYRGPEEPFGPELAADLASIGCDLELE